ncbi:MAG: hypothetical protein ACOC1F_02275 [Myxococcota bacterium]
MKPVVFAILVAGFTLGCGANNPAPKPAEKPAPAPPSVLHDDDWGRFRSHRHGLSVPFPDGESWRIDDTTSLWLDARHPGTSSRLRARAWLEPKPVSRAYCESEARRFAPDLPQPDEAGTIDEYETGELFAPDFVSHVVIGLGELAPNTDVIGGYVLAIGVAGRRCAVLSFTTQVSGGPKATTVLAERLEIGTRMAENTLFVSRLPSGPLEPMPTP